MQLNSREAITHAIMQNIGIGFVSVVEYIALPGACPVSFIDEPLHIEYYLCCLRICRQRSLIENFPVMRVLNSYCVKTCIQPCNMANDLRG